MKAIILKNNIPGPRRGTRICAGARIKVSDAEAARLIGARAAVLDDGVGWSKPSAPKPKPMRKAEPKAAEPE